MTHLALATIAIGTNYNAPIASVGGVFFDIATGKLGAEFYQEIALDSSLKHSRVGSEALAQLIRDGHSEFGLFMTDHDRKLSLPTTMHNFCTFVRGGIAPRVWGMGTTGDLVWVEHAIQTGTVGLGTPWHLTNTRDIRTLLAVADVADPYALVPRTGAKEDALAEAKWRAKLIHACLAKVTGQVTPQVTGKAKGKSKPAPDRYWQNPTTQDCYVAPEPAAPSDVELTKEQFDEATDL